MTIAGTNLDSLPAAGTQGWNLVYDDNIQEIANKLNGPLLPSTSSALGDDTVADPAATTAEALTDSSGGVATNTINDVGASFNQATLNNNFASLVDEINKLRADNVELRTQLLALLTALRKTTGCGVLDG